jgi:hypothetical protein
MNPTIETTILARRIPTRMMFKSIPTWHTNTSRTPYHGSCWHYHRHLHQIYHDQTIYIAPTLKILDDLELDQNYYKYGSPLHLATSDITRDGDRERPSSCGPWR